MRLGRGLGLTHRRRRSAGGGPPPDTDDPVLQSATWAANGLSAALVYNEAVDPATVLAAGGWTLGGTSATVNGASASGNTVTVTTTTAVLQGETVTITTSGAPVEDLAGNPAATLTDQATTNNSTEPAPVETVVDTLVTGTSWQSPAALVGTSLNVAAWGGGQSGTINTKAGDDGDCSVVDDTIAADTSYSYTIGAGGASAGAAGGDTTWRTNVCIAPGGASATVAVGDTTNAGGTGGIGEGNQNSGGSGGTSTAGGGGNGGEPDGACANPTSGAATCPGSGGRSTVTLGVAGAPGLIRLKYQQTPNPAYPWIDTQSNGRNAANAIEHTLLVPGTHKVGTVLLVFVAKDGGAGQMSLSAGTKLADIASSTVAALGVWVLDSVDVPSLTLTTDSQILDSAVLRIDNCAAAASIDLTAAAVAAAANWTPPAHTHGAGSVAALWIVAHATDGSNGGAVPGKPAGYGQHTYWPPGDGPPNTGGAGLQFSMRRVTAATETPGLVSAGTRAGAAATICIPVAS